MRGFTLIEVLISFAIVSIIFGSVVGVFRNFMYTRGKNDDMMRYSQEIQFLEKQIYLDCIRISPALRLNTSGDLFVAGEETDQPIPEEILLYDTDANTQNGYEVMRMFLGTLSALDRREKVEYSFKQETGKLIRKSGSKSYTLGENLTEFHFFPLKRGLKLTGKEKKGKTVEDFSTAFSFLDGFVRIEPGGEYTE
ncbi:MAG: type II secretion system protein [Candidatus Wallbacteria bacterium]|nr:type II secretion system protein [Candidatus Wallbacteria bacterium]